MKLPYRANFFVSESSCPIYTLKRGSCVARFQPYTYPGDYDRAGHAVHIELTTDEGPAQYDKSLEGGRQMYRRLLSQGWTRL